MSKRLPPDHVEDPEKTEDDQLWRAVTHDVTPLKNKNHINPPKNPQKRRLKAQNRAQEADFAPKTPYPRPIKAEKPDKSVDSRNLERFRKGKMPIEGRVDLHGMNQHEAHRALERFIVAAHGAGKRCVLVITGKGDRERGKAEAQTQDWLAPRAGVLRERVPQWLEDEPLGPLVLQITQAQAQDGGSGALYVLLRRRR